MRIPLPFAGRERARIDRSTISALEIAAHCRSIDEILQFWIAEAAEAVRPDEARIFRQDGDRWIRIFAEDHGSEPQALTEAVLAQALGSAEPVAVGALGRRDVPFVLARFSGREGWRGVLGIWGSGGGQPRRLRRAGALAAAIGRSATLFRRCEIGREQAISTERSRWAAELHDGHLQTLSSVKLVAEVCAALEERHEEVCLPLGQPHLPSKLRAELARLTDLVNETVREARHYLLELRPPPSESSDLVPWLRAYADDFERESRVAVELRIEGSGELPRGQVQDTIRLIREALTNVRKHAKAGSVRIAIVFSESGTSISISDDGVGFELRTKLEELIGSTHNGLSGSRDRVESIGGEMRLRSEPGKGTTVSFRLPPEGRPSSDERRRREKEDRARSTARDAKASPQDRP
jgi:signal transduction histidine kinase